MAHPSPHPRRLAALLAAAALLALALAPLPARAASPRASGVDVQQLRPGPGASDYLGVLGGFVGPHLNLAAGLLFNHADAPLLTARSGRAPKLTLLDAQGTFDLLLSVSAWDLLELGVVAPLVGPSTPGPAFDTTPGLVRPSAAWALGDLRLVPKVALVQLGRTFGLALAAPIALPTGSDFAGYGALSVSPTLVADFAPADYFRLTFNGGARFRPAARFSDLTLGRELVWGLGMKFSFLVGDQLLSVVGDFRGAFELPDAEAENPPFEFLAGLEWRAVPNLTLTAAVGAGITRGYGSPDLRTLFGLRYSAWRDCVTGPEDLDGFEDDDACADPDNDADGRLDEVDLCPNEPETPNGLDDDDGCPDRLPSFVTLDRLPPDAGLESERQDSDGDGVVDALDACPTAAEDPDGFEDSDGCPDPDNDADGLLDDADRCPVVAETANGFEDGDGCPDDAPTRARVDELSRTIVITEKVFFETGRARIEAKSDALLDEIARLLVSRTDLRKVRVSGYTDSLGSDRSNLRLSRDRAVAVRAALVARGVAAERIEAQGYGEANPVASNATAEGREQNRRVEFHILDSLGGPP